jgi:hypothetical protein
MKKLLVSMFALAALAGCADDKGTPITYDNNDLELAVGNSARMGCSCMFVMEMPEAYCRAWVKASPDVAKVTFDVANKRVESSAFVSWAATARFVDEKRGCILE